MVSSLEASPFLPLYPLHRLPKNDIDVLNHFKHKFAISMLWCLSILDRTIKTLSPFMIPVFRWYESIVLHVH
jgi:hypothetical protein